MRQLSRADKKRCKSQYFFRLFFILVPDVDVPFWPRNKGELWGDTIGRTAWLDGPGRPSGGKLNCADT